MKNEDGIEGVVLGCTELPLLLNESNCSVKCLDSVERIKKSHGKLESGCKN